MARFDYTAINKQDKTVKGTIEATGRDAATELLRKQGLKPILVHEQKTGFDPNNLKFDFLKRKRVRGKDLVVFTRQLSTMVSAGVPLVRSLATLQTQTRNKYFQEVLGEVSKDVEGGISLADAFAKHPKVFSPVYINMVKAGEAGGILDEILKRLAFQQEKDNSIRHKIKSAMTYPIVLLVITTIAFFTLMIFIMPRIGKIIKDLGGEDAELPIYTEIMLGISDFLVTYWYLIIIAAIGGTIFLRRFAKTTNGRKLIHRILLKVPILKTLITKVAIARFARTFASLMSSGVTVLDALHVTAGAIGNVVIEAELAHAAAQVKNGKPLSDPLSKSKLFPPMVAQMIAVGEETGEIDTILVKVADAYEEEVDAFVDGLSSIIEPVMIIILGALVGLIAASVMGPISSLTKSIQ